MVWVEAADQSKREEIGNEQRPFQGGTRLCSDGDGHRGKVTRCIGLARVRAWWYLRNPVFNVLRLSQHNYGIVAHSNLMVSIR